MAAPFALLLAADLREQRDLSSRDAERLGLAPQLAGKAQQHRAKLVGECPCAGAILSHDDH